MKLMQILTRCGFATEFVRKKFAEKLMGPGDESMAKIHRRGRCRAFETLHTTPLVS